MTQRIWTEWWRNEYKRNDDAMNKDGTMTQWIKTEWWRNEYKRNDDVLNIHRALTYWTSKNEFKVPAPISKSRHRFQSPGTDLSRENPTRRCRVKFKIVTSTRPLSFNPDTAPRPRNVKCKKRFYQVRFLEGSRGFIN